MNIIECPRDAMQGVKEFIPTEKKITYLNLLLKVGFYSIDFGSFVSPQAIPQLRDTHEVISRLDTENTETKLLAIVANTRGAKEAVNYSKIDYVGFPFSISETFQQRNTNKSIPEALNTLDEIQNLCIRHGKTLVTYISMGFGNPYNDPYDVSIVAQFTDVLVTMGITTISLADTIGVSTPGMISHLFRELIRAYPSVEFGAHLHSTPDKAIEKIEAAHAAGCTRFDGALQGFGGCPMAEDELVGNIATETILSQLETKNTKLGINKEHFDHALVAASQLFGQYR